MRVAAVKLHVGSKHKATTKYLTPTHRSLAFSTVSLAQCYLKGGSGGGDDFNVDSKT